MADSNVAITSGSGTNIDTRTEGTNSNHRQVVVLGDPATNAGVAPVNVTNGLAVDVKQIVSGTGATNLGKAEDAAHSSGDSGVMSLSVRKNTAAATSGTDGDYQPLITDTNGRLHTIDVSTTAALSGSELQVDVVAALPAGSNAIGTVTANLSATDNAVLDTIDAVLDTIKTDTEAIETAVEILDNAISGSEMQVDVVASLPAGTNNIGDVDIASSLPAGTNAIGKLSANSGVDIGDVDILSIAAGDNNIGNVDIASLPASTNTIEVVGDAAENAAAAGNPVMVGGRFDSSARTLGNGDVGAIALDADGAVQISDGGNAITVDGTVTANLSATDNAVLDTIDAVLDNVLTKNTEIDAVLDTIDADTGAIKVAVELIDNAISGSEMQVDVVASLPSGSNTIGVVDLGSTDNAVLDAIATDGDNIQTLLSTLDGVQDSALTKLGEIETTNNANQVLLGTIDADTGSIKTAVEIIDNAISGSEMQVDVVASLPAGSNAIGKLAANSGVDIGDVDITSITGVTMSNAGIQTTGDEAHDAADAGNPMKLGGRAQSSEAQPDEVADNDRVDALFDRSGYLRVRGDFDPSFADINDSTSGNNTIIAAAGSGKRIAVWSILIVSDGTTDVRWEDGAGGTAFTGQVPLQAREGYSWSAGGMVPLFVGSANTLLNLELTAGINVHGGVSYTVIDD